MLAGTVDSERCNMKSKRTLTSIIYVAVIVCLMVMKWLVPQNYGAFGFDALFTLIAVVGTFELLRAVDCVSQKQRAVAYVYASLSVPVYAVTATLYNNDIFRIPYLPSASSAAVAAACIVAMVLLTVFDHPHSNLKSTAFCIFTMFYSGFLPVILCAVNHMPFNSTYAILYMFVVAVLTDTMAYLGGKTLHKQFPQKMSPDLSPNKTKIGCISGVVGGLLGAVASYYFYCWAQGGFTSLGALESVGNLITITRVPVVVYIVIFTVLTSLIVQVGDLFESAIKRYCNIKDMGNCLPGHGGILDRFDSMLFSAPVVLLIFSVIAVQLPLS